MGIAFLPLFIRYLGMEAYGLIGLFALMQSWLSLLDMGMAPTLNREMARYRAGAYDTDAIKDLLRSLEFIFLIVALLITILIWSCSSILASHWLKVEKLPIQVVSQAISVMAFVVALRFIEGMYRSSLLGLNKQIWFNSVSAILATVRQLGAIGVLALISPTIHAFFIWQALISLITVIVLAYGVHSSIPNTDRNPRFSKTLVMSVWKFAGGMLTITILSILLTQIDKVLLSKLLTLENFGFYTLSSTVASVIYMTVGPVTQAIYPKMVELVTHGNQQALIDVYHKGSQFITVLVAPLAILISVYAQGVIFAWSGDQLIAKHTSMILSVLILGTFLNSLMYLPYHLQLANGWTGFAIKVNIVSVCFLVPAILWVVPRYGAIGSAYIWLILNVSYTFIAIPVMHLKLLKSEKWRWYFSDVLYPTFGVILVVLFSQIYKPVTYESRVNWLLFLVGTGLLSFIVASLFSSQLRRYLSIKTIESLFNPRVG